MEKHAQESVGQGTVVKDSILEKAIGSFLADDYKQIGESIGDSYIKPRLTAFVKQLKRKTQEFVVDSLTGMIQMIVFGKRQDQNVSGWFFGQQPINYVNYYQSSSSNGYTSYLSQTNPVNPAATPVNPLTVLKPIAIPDYGTAQKVLTEMISLSKRYPTVSVADYYQLLQVPSTAMDYNWGWKELYKWYESTVNEGKDPVKYVKNAYMLVLPKPIPIG